MKAIYKIDYYRLVVWFLPTFLRNPILVELLRTMITPIILLQNTFDAFRYQADYDLGINPQVCYLQKMLNDNFDIDKRRIQIQDANSFQRLYIYTPQESNPIYLYTRTENKPVYFFNKEDFTDTGFDFYVLLNGVKLTTQQRVTMRVLIDKYKLVTKKYEIR